MLWYVNTKSKYKEKNIYPFSLLYQLYWFLYRMFWRYLFYIKKEPHVFQEALSMCPTEAGLSVPGSATFEGWTLFSVIVTCMVDSLCGTLWFYSYSVLTVSCVHGEDTCKHNCTCHFQSSASRQIYFLRSSLFVLCIKEAQHVFATVDNTHLLCALVTRLNEGRLQIWGVWVLLSCCYMLPCTSILLYSRVQSAPISFPTHPLHTLLDLEDVLTADHVNVLYLPLAAKSL